MASEAIRNCAQDSTEKKAARGMIAALQGAMANYCRNLRILDPTSAGILFADICEGANKKEGLGLETDPAHWIKEFGGETDQDVKKRAFEALEAGLYACTRMRYLGSKEALDFLTAESERAGLEKPDSVMLNCLRAEAASKEEAGHE